MPGENDDALWSLLAHAIHNKIVILVNILNSYGNRVEKEKFLNLANQHPDIMPTEASGWKDVFVFKIPLLSQSKQYKVCFNSSVTFKNGDNVEYFNRGCSFVRDMLNFIFSRYNVLKVNNVNYADDESKAPPIREFVDAECASGTKLIENEIVLLKEDRQEGNFRYRIGFWVTVKDQIDKVVKSKFFNVDLSVEFDDNGKPIYSDRKVTFNDSVDESVDAAALMSNEMLNDNKDIDNDTREALIKLAQRLQSPEEKEEIFKLLLSGKNEVSDYILERENAAVDNNEPAVYRYNVIALTMYLDRVQRKQYPYSMSVRGKTARFEVQFDPMVGLEEITCPTCRAKIKRGGKNRLRLALNGDGKAVVACHECSKELRSSSHPVYTTSYSKLSCFANAAIVSADHEGNTYEFFKQDVVKCDLDGKLYSEESCRTANYVFSKKRRVVKEGTHVALQNGYVLEPAEEGQLFPKRFVSSCANCNDSYAALPTDEQEMSSQIFRKVEDSSSLTACIHCVDVPKSQKPDIKHEIYASEMHGASSPVYFVNSSNAVQCYNCGKIGYTGKDKMTECSLCGAFVCDECLVVTEFGDVCKDCYDSLKEAKSLYVASHDKRKISMEDIPEMGKRRAASEHRAEFNSARSKMIANMRAGDRRGCAVALRKDRFGNSLAYALARPKASRGSRAYCFIESNGKLVLLNSMDITVSD